MASLVLPDIYEDEDGTCYYAFGHVDLARFRDAVIVYELTECKVGSDNLSILDPEFQPQHVYLRPDADDEYGEKMARCSHSDEGAQKFTVVAHK